MEPLYVHFGFGSSKSENATYPSYACVIPDSELLINSDNNFGTLPQYNSIQFWDSKRPQKVDSILGLSLGFRPYNISTLS